MTRKLHTTLQKRMRQTAKSFLSDNGGNIAIIAALSLPVVIGAIGAGIDFSRASAIKSALQQSVDAASQKLTDTVATCHSKNRTNDVTTDTGCMNDPQFVQSLRASASTLVTENFKQQGYSSPPTLTGPLEVDKINGRLNIAATVGYNCMVFHILRQDCNIQTSSATSANLSTQADTMSISGATGSRRIYVGESSTNLPIVYTTTGGWTPVSWGVTGMPAGLNLTPAANTKTATIAGTPTDGSGCAHPSACDPVTLSPTGVTATDAGDKNRGGLNKQRVQAVVNFQLIRPLRISLTGVMTTPATGVTATSNYAQVTRSGGTGSYTYSCTGVPTGMTCNTSTGRVSGTPAYWQTGTLTVTVRDNNDNRTHSASIGYNFNPPTLNFSIGPSLVGRNAEYQSVAVTASGGVGVLNITCSGLPAGYTLRSYPAQQSNNGRIDGEWISNGSMNASGTINCTASDQAGQTRSASRNWSMSYIGNDDCLSTRSIRCPGEWQGSYNNCVNGNGRYVCHQYWTWSGGDLTSAQVSPPNGHAPSPTWNVCTTDGVFPPDPPPPGWYSMCTGQFFGCTTEKGFWKRNNQLRCLAK